MRADIYPSLLISIYPSKCALLLSSIQVVLMMDPSWDLKRWQKMVLTVDSPVTKSKIINHRGLKSRIISLYGGDTWSEINLLEKTRANIARRATDLHFLKSCHDNNIIPPFAQINHRFHNRYNRKAFFQLSMSLIRAEIKRVRATLDNLGCSALSARLKLSSIISENLWSVIDSRAALKSINEGQVAEKR